MIPFDFDSIFTGMAITLPAPHLLQIKVPQPGVDTEQVRSSTDHRLTKAIICLFASSIRSSWNGFR